MKKMRRLFALVLTTAMALALAVTANAADNTVSITIRRDGSFDGTDGSGRTYTYYKIFSASYSSNTSTGGGSTDGAPGDVTASAANASYTATRAVAEKLGTWNSSSKSWEREDGNDWFDLTPIAGTDTYSVKWIAVQKDDDGEPVLDDNGDPVIDNSAAAVQAAADWLIENKAYESGPTALTFSNGEWTSGDIAPGYYVIDSNLGKNLIAATSDISIDEKNDYPSLDKTQADEDHIGNQGDAVQNVAVGDVLTYHVKVTIPATAKEHDKILVWDKASAGLTYNNDLRVSNPGKATIGEPEDSFVDNSWTWCKLITVTEGSQGKDVVFTFTMTVNNSALVDSEKQNESGLKYGNDNGFPYESKPDSVKYKTYFAGIYKFDADTKVALEGVEFTLKEDGSEFKMSKAEGTDYYVYDVNGDTTVKTDANGLIKIRGLDADKTYTLTETKNPNEGYNMLADPVTLTLMPDTTTSTTYTPVASDTAFDSDATYYIKEGDTYTVAEGLTGFANDVTYYTVETKSELAFSGVTYDKFDQVENKKGTVLPSTGGIGTKIFYGLGAVLVVGAGVVLVSRKRADA